MGRLGYVPSLLCDEFVMGRVCHVPSLPCAELSLNPVKQAVKIEPIKYMGSTCLFVLFFNVQKKQSICDKIAFLYFT